MKENKEDNKMYHSFFGYEFKIEQEDKKFIDEWGGLVNKETKFEIIKIKNNNMKKQIELSLEQARSMYGKCKEMDELLLANFSKEELTKPVLPKTWEDLNTVGGYFILRGYNSVHKIALEHSPAEELNGDVYCTEKQAMSALAMAKLSQLMYVYNDGWEPDWSNSSPKYVVRRYYNKLEADIKCNIYEFLSFKTKELRDLFLKNFEDLIKQYFMID